MHKQCYRTKHSVQHEPLGKGGTLCRPFAEEEVPSDSSACTPKTTTQPLAPASIDVDAASSSAPQLDWLSEGDVFPTDIDAALKKEDKSVKEM